MTCIDLKSKLRFSPLLMDGDAGHVRRQVHIFSTHGFCSLATFANLYRSQLRRLQNPNIPMCGTVPRNGIRPINLPPQFARGRGVSSSSPTQALPFGHSKLGFAQQHGLGQPHTRLANLCRLRSNSHPESQATLSGRRPRTRSRRHRVRFGRHHYRLVPFAISLGKVSSYQRGDQVAYPAESPGRYSRIHTDIRLETARRQCFGSPLAGAWRVLRDGSRLSRLRAFVCFASSEIILCHPLQKQFQVQASLFPRGGQNHRRAVRSNDHLGYLLFRSRLPGAVAPHLLLRCGTRQAASISDQRFHLAGDYHRCSLQIPLANRIVFQMDKTAPTDQSLFRNQRKRRQVTNMDRRINLPAGGDPKKGTRPPIATLHNLTDFESHPI